MRKLLILIISISLFSACVAFLESQEKLEETQSLLVVDFKGKVRKDILYSEGLSFDLYLPQDCNSPEAKTLFFFIHKRNSTLTDGTERLFCRSLPRVAV